MALEQVRPARDAEYYLRETSLTDPKFEGKGARLLGIEGQPIDRATFLNLYAGYTTDEQGNRDKKLPKYMHPARRGAFDMTVNNPKDVSLANLVGGDARIDEVVAAAKKAVADEVEKQARVRVTKKSEIEKSKAKMPKGWRRPDRRPENLVMVWFDHSSSRMSDPALHSHLVIMNLSHDKQEGMWKALELGHLDQQKISDIYRDTMRKGLHQLGYKTKREGKEYRIVGTPPEIKAMFSRRHEAIADMQMSSGQFKSVLGVARLPRSSANPLRSPATEKAWQGVPPTRRSIAA